MQLLAAVLAASVSWSLTDSNGKYYESGALVSRRTTVIVTLAPDCPKSDRARPGLNEMQAAYQSKGVLFYGVLPGRWPRESPKRMPIGFPLLLDPELKLTRQTGARVTPEAVVVDRKGTIAYLGKTEGLNDALEDLLGGRAVRRPFLRVAGCAISGIDARVALPTAPRFNRDVAPLLRRQCVECHRAGGAAPFALTSYEEAAPRAAAMADAVRTRRMPPWKPDPGPPHFEGERRLTAPEIATLAAWSRAGAPEAQLLLQLEAPCTGRARTGSPRGPAGARSLARRRVRR